MSSLTNHGLRLAAGLLWCAVATAAPSGGGATPPSAPTFPYLDRNGYHTVLTGKWRLTAPATVVSGAGPDATTLANLPADTALRALKVEILTLRPAVCEALRGGTLAIRQWVNSGGKVVDEREQKVGFRRGERVYELDYYGEGECSIWFKGVTGIAECGMNGLTGGAELCRYVGPDKPVNEVWAYVQTANGQRGWIRNPKANGMSRHD